MKVALVVSVFPQGSETFIVNKFLRLRDRGHDVRVLCRRRDKAHWDLFPRLGRLDARSVMVRPPLQPRPLAALWMPFVLLSCLLRAPRTTFRALRRAPATRGVLKQLYLQAPIVRWRPDVVHYEFGALARDSIRFIKHLGCQAVVSFRGHDLNYVALDRPDFYRPVWDHADAVHVLGQDLWRRAVRRGCPPDKPHVLIPPAIETEAFRPAHPRTGSSLPADGEIRLLTVARLCWTKGHEYLLQAVRLLVDRGWEPRLRLVGGGNHEDAVFLCRHQLGLDRHVTVLGSLAHEDTISQYAWADVFVAASVCEGFNNAVIEAQASGVAVVCSDAGGLPENIDHGTTGFVVPRRDPVALADRIEELASDPSMRQLMGDAGRRRARRLFDLEDQTQAFERLYESLVASKPCP